MDGTTRRRLARQSGVRALLAAGAAVTACLLGALPAAASTTFGANLSSVPDGMMNGYSGTIVTDPGGTPDNGAPVAGVLTTARIQTTGAAADGVIRVLRQVGHPDAATYSLENIGEVPVHTTADATTAGHTSAVGTRIPIQVGDRLGIQLTGSGGTVHDAHKDSTGQCAFGLASQPVGSTLDYTTNQCNHNLPLVAGTIEPDIDGDGFGDETQDQCPTDPTTQGPCAADLSVAESPSVGTINLGQSVLFIAVVKNNSPFNTAKNVAVSDPLSSGLTLISATGGTCAGGTCTLGDIPKGSTAIATFLAQATAAGAQSDTATATSSTPDPAAGNNTATATVQVLPPFSAGTFGGVRLVGKSVTVDRHGRVTIKLACPASAAGNCKGRDTLKTAGRVTAPRLVAAKRKAKILRLGTGTFTIPAGKSAKVTIKLNKTARKLLAKRHTLKVKETVVAHDLANKPVTTTGSLKLKATKAQKKH